MGDCTNGGDVTTPSNRYMTTYEADNLREQSIVVERKVDPDI